MTTFKLLGTPAEEDYKGCGHAIMFLNNEIPSKLLYFYDIFDEFYPGEQYTDNEIMVFIADERMDKAIQLYPNLGISFVGMCSCYEFVEL